MLYSKLAYGYSRGKCALCTWNDMCETCKMHFAYFLYVWNIFPLSCLWGKSNAPIFPSDRDENSSEKVWRGVSCLMNRNSLSIPLYFPLQNCTVLKISILTMKGSISFGLNHRYLNHLYNQERYSALILYKQSGMDSANLLKGGNNRIE